MKFFYLKKDQCEYKYVNDLVVECGNIYADYIYGKYRFIPKQSTNTFSIRSLAIDIDSNPFGILISSNYPNYERNVNDSVKLVTLDLTKSIRIIVTDLLIADSECDNEKLEVNDGLTEPYSWCGGIGLQNTYEYITCSDTLTVNYKTSKGITSDINYRGFRAYFELIDKPASCYGSTSKSTTGPVLTTNTPITTKPIPQTTIPSDLSNNKIMIYLILQFFSLNFQYVNLFFF